MEKRVHLYVSRKNVLTWLMALCLVGSAVARIVVFSGLEGAGVWSQIILPVAASLLYAAITIFGGKEFFYKTALPVWLMGIHYAVLLRNLLPGNPFVFGMYCTCILFFCLLYAWITSGRIRWPWLLVPMFIATLAASVYVHRQLDPEYMLSHFGSKMPPVALVLPEYLLFGGLLILCFAIKVHTDGKYHPTWGDRSDGRRIRSIPPMDQLSPYIMVNRNGSNNLFSESVEITNLERYVRRKRREGLTTFGLAHVIFTAYVRTVAKYPALNRFIAGQKVYSHGEDVQLCMTIKKEMSTSSPDTVVKVHLNPHDTAEDVYRKFNAQVEAARSEAEDSNFDNTAGIMALIPGLFLKFVVWLLKAMDYFGLIPRFLLEVSPFHGSAYFTSMGSLGICPIYHHLYDFGVIPVFCAFGRKRRATEVLEDGSVVQRKYVDLKFTVDERICDGYYYAALIKHFVRLISHPEVLDEPPVEVVKDID